MTTTLPSADRSAGTETSGTLATRVLLVLASLTAVAPLVTDIYLPALPDVARGFGISDSLTQVTMSVSITGLALGQLVVGPLSDRVGRLRPLRWGLVLLAATSFLCAVSGNIWILLGARLLQGMSGAAAVVIARTIVRDVYEGPRVAKVYSELMLVMGLAPVVGPIVGGLLLQFTDWRGIFVVLGLLALTLLAASRLTLVETRPGGGGHAGPGLLDALRSLVADRRFVCYLAITGLGGVLLFSYISMSSFVFQDGFGVSALGYACIFGANAVGMVIGSQLSARLVMRLGAMRILLGALVVVTVASLLLLAAQALGAPLMIVLIPLWFVLAGFGGIGGNATALALEPHRELAGTASALLGAATFILGGLVPPLVSIGGTGGAVMGLTMAVAALLALGVFLLVRRLKA